MIRYLPPSYSWDPLRTTAEKMKRIQVVKEWRRAISDFNKGGKVRSRWRRDTRQGWGGGGGGKQQLVVLAKARQEAGPEGSRHIPACRRRQRGE